VPGRAVKQAARAAGIVKHVSCHTLRATRLPPTCLKAAPVSTLP
jgi:integrase